MLVPSEAWARGTGPRLSPNSCALLAIWGVPPSPWLRLHLHMALALAHVRLCVQTSFENEDNIKYWIRAHPNELFII